MLFLQPALDLFFSYAKGNDEKNDTDGECSSETGSVSRRENDSKSEKNAESKSGAAFDEKSVQLSVKPPPLALNSWKTLTLLSWNLDGLDPVEQPSRFQKVFEVVNRLVVIFCCFK